MAISREARDRMGRKYFGTDGIRGRANDGVLDAATAMKVGQAAGRHFLRGTHKHRIIIGKCFRRRFRSQQGGTLSSH